MGSHFQQCAQCIMDAQDDPFLTFDISGVCTHCYAYQRRKLLFVEKNQTLPSFIAQQIEKIKHDGRYSSYDCITGVSGGIDSTYLTYLAKEWGLRPLVVHFDNGWNSELAVKNIQNTVNKLGFDLKTLVVDWEEFKDLQRSYIKAGVVDIEVPTDHAILATLYHTANKHNIRHLFLGTNILTEGLMPTHWVWSKLDLLNLQSIHQKHGTVKLKTYPQLGFWNRIYYEKILKFQIHEPLNWITYNKTEAQNILTKTLGWRDYGGKHHESIFTRFYQGYILPQKFGIDKRKAHLSCLILSHQITKNQALEEISHPIYSQLQLQEDKQLVLKKLGYTENEFDQMMRSTPVSHLQYDSYFKKHYKTHTQITKKIAPILDLKHKLFKTQKAQTY